jgi:hypothetical protein
MTTSTKSTVVLDSPAKWPTWLFVVKTLATGPSNVWEYINPEVMVPKPQPMVLIEPTYPSITQIDPSLIDNIQLNPDERA